jgi:hypothetical protein
VRLRSHACVPLYQSFPDWSRHLAWAGLDRVPAWDLYRCVRREASPAGRRAGRAFASLRAGPKW